MYNPAGESADTNGMLETSVAALDPIVALLSLIHITGDQMLLHRYGPLLDGTQEQVREAFVNFGGDEEHKQADPAVVAEIRGLLIKELQNGRPEVLLHDPAPGLFREMLKLALGLELPEASFEVARQHGGFVTDTRIIPQDVMPPADFKVLVIGAGMVGINSAVKLKQSGFNFTVIESRHEMGGTWSINRYPGAAVDTPSILYSYSFDPNPSWTKYYPMKDEFLKYLEKVADRHRVRDNIDFNTTMTDATWDDARKLWVVKAVRDGQEVTYEANAVIQCLGHLTRARWPDVADREKFPGPVMHSAEWDESVDLTGKRVVIVGTGCSGVQLTRALSEVASHVTVVQRQPDYIIPNPQALFPVPPADIWAMENIPYVTQWKRMQGLLSSLTDMRGMMGFDQEWHDKTGGFGMLNDAVTKMSLDYLASCFPDDPDMVARLTPPYPLYAKRPILDCGYYDALKKPHVDLIEGELKAFDEQGIVLSDGRHIACDAVVLATGFYLEWYSGLNITGRGGKKLRDAFTPYPEAYEGILVPEFPNYLITAGPNTGLTANHAVLGEQHVHYIIELLQMMVNGDYAAVEVDPAVFRAFNDETEAATRDTAWFRNGKAHGYYQHDGSKRIVLGTPRHNSTVWHDTRKPKPEHLKLERKPGVPERQPRKIEKLSI